MSRASWVYEMIEAGKTDEEIIASLLEGNAMKGIKPIGGKGAPNFAKLHLWRAKKKLSKKQETV